MQARLATHGSTINAVHQRRLVAYARLVARAITLGIQVLGLAQKSEQRGQPDRGVDPMKLLNRDSRKSVSLTALNLSIRWRDCLPFRRTPHDRESSYNTKTWD